MNGNEDETNHNEATTPMVGDATNNKDNQTEEDQGGDNKDYANGDSKPDDISNSQNDDSNNLQMGSAPPFAAKELKNVKSAGNHNVKAEESGSTNLILEEPAEQKTSKLENLDLAATVGGSQTRQYLNANVTPHLLAGMRHIAVQQPNDPLRVLGEYLIEQSNIRKGGQSECDPSVREP